MEAPICIRPAILADVGIISRIIERSIRFGCALDHRNDPQIVSLWTRQQSADFLGSRLADPYFYLSIALLADKPVGVAMAQASGDISICHVQPECFRRGVGRALMSDLEGWLRVRGVSLANLDSTRTGEAFYRRLGYREAALPLIHNGLHILPMSKRLPLSG
ncbi:ribosomal protein S18 acetylase RimI-like enzyme [Pseudomonas baetica]|uniref:Ribosomal protein S18 acetylase RimI-like enzyme n=1 Tax=Pseudomonas baetica TaxID=674054 RepID=A0ABX4Q650_9PSED|nr:GNAT family N-acetyltransferase [Pseudomonas baetica]PKA72275.1 ribosomal protein S18 acetylase RimI-like enzyme [Pseudomonas baetica]PTC17268.1 GNAT family N-acetyltransferase [Pseudomonas baetica]